MYDQGLGIYASKLGGRARSGGVTYRSSRTWAVGPSAQKVLWLTSSELFGERGSVGLLNSSLCSLLVGQTIHFDDMVQPLG